METQNCAVEGCGRLARERGWCWRHYMRWWRRGDPTAPPARLPLRVAGRPRCSEPECPNTAIARGLCPMHYERRKATGDLPMRTTTLSELPPLEIPREDAIYLAGLFDGEGTICVSVSLPRASRRQRTAQYALHAAVSMLDRPTIQTFATLFGGSHYTDCRNGEHQSLARWYCNQWRAARAIHALQPFLRIKRRQAELALEFMQTFPHTDDGRGILPAAMLEQRVRLCNEIALLNHSHWLKKR